MAKEEFLQLKLMALPFLLPTVSLNYIQASAVGEALA
jgi:hypothetical protein